MALFWKEIPQLQTIRSPDNGLPTYFWVEYPTCSLAKFSEIILSDSVAEGGFPVAMEVECLQQKYDIRDHLLREHDKNCKGIENFPIKDIIFGLLKGIPTACQCQNIL